MSLINAAWQALEASGQLGTLKRIDPSHTSAFYATRDFIGRRGLLLVTPIRPKVSFQLKALDVVTVHEVDGWHLYIWLTNPELLALFCVVCNDLLESCRSQPDSEIPTVILLRLQRWRKLLEAGSSGLLTVAELRGLIGELVVFRDFIPRAGAAECVLAWRGPLDAPQDFAFEHAAIEVKTIGPSAVRVRINSVHQLDDTLKNNLLLAIVKLAPVSVEAMSGFSVSECIAEIRNALNSFPQARDEFESRLRAAGYIDNHEYEQYRFRVDDFRYFSVQPAFPRLTPADLMPGIADASYDIDLSSLASFEVVLPPFSPA